MKLSYQDRQHSYWLDGRRCKSITTVAKIPDDTYGLDQWRKRQVAIGMAISPPLIERAAAHHDDKDKLNAIAEEAMAAAKSHEAADRGTAAHRITERIDLEELVIDTPMAQAVRRAWTAALDKAGLEIVPEFVERIVVYPDRLIAGRFDRLARRKDGSLVVLDLKTGAGAIRYPHSIACQLALYAHAPLLAGDLAGGSTTEFTDLPKGLDRERAVIVHMPADDTVEVHEIDIAAGWEIVQTACFPILDWRRRDNLIKPVTSISCNLAETRKDGGDVPDRTKHLRQRIAALKDNHDARTIVAKGWPTGVSVKPPWTAGEQDAIAATLADAEKAVRAPFPPDNTPIVPPAKPEPTPAVEHAPNLRFPDDGPMVTDEDVQALKRAIGEQLTETERAAAQQWIRDGSTQGRPWSGGKDGMSTRAFMIARAALVCAKHLRDDIDGDLLTRAALADVLSKPLQPSWWTGAVLGSLTIEQAERLHDIAQAFADGDDATVRRLGELAVFLKPPSKEH